MQLETRRVNADFAALLPSPGRAFLIFAFLVFGSAPSSAEVATVPQQTAPAGITVPAVLNLNYGTFAAEILWRPDGTGLAATVLADTQQLNSQVLLWGLKAGDPLPRMTAGRSDGLTRWLDNDTIEYSYTAHTDRPSPSLYKALKWTSKTMVGETRQGFVPRYLGREKVYLKGGKWVAYIDFDDTRVIYPLVVKEVAGGKELFRSPKDASVFEFGVCESKDYIAYGAKLETGGELHRVTISDWKDAIIGNSRNHFRSIAIRSSNGDFAEAGGRFARQPGIWIYRADGSLKSASPPELYADCPAWSPDGLLLAFVARGREIRVIKGDPMSAEDWNARPSAAVSLGWSTENAATKAIQAHRKSK